MVILDFPCGGAANGSKPENKKPGTQAGQPWIKKKPDSRAGFIVDTHEKRATAYPAECRYNGRRAREVMPAAARALVSTVAV
ncbi:MAG: hypothetical protein KGH90_09835 [Xanthomonadaceae bacterium]|jgi:hypothetical protein|nr:hypothetical protein [Xanthomonadaceae bacterium]